VARVKTRLARKLEGVLTQRFPPPATVRLEEHNGIIGVVTSTEFARMDSVDRQSLIGDLVATHLDPDERRRVLVIVAVTPDEGTGYLAGA
jgi:hypothetical protein